MVHATTATVTMPIGLIEEHFVTTRIDPGASFTLPRKIDGAASHLLVRFVIPDDLDGHAYDFEVRANGRTVMRRGGHTRGCGRRTFFAPLTSAAFRSSAPIHLSVVNHDREALHLESIEPLRDLDRWLAEPPPDDDFTFSLLMNRAEQQPDLYDVVDDLHKAPGVRLAMSKEIYYARLPREEIRAQAQRIRRACDKHKVAFYPIMCSWWAGTPREVFERLDFQQICWSESDNFDEGPELRRLLGDRWDIRYGLTTPNMWSNVPWQTMNHPELNAMRHERMAAAVRLVEEELGDRIRGYVTENEPAYWAFADSDSKYPVKRTNLWADFNPHTVEAARRDGIELDPSGGLGVPERMWLHRNLARYQENTVASIRGGGTSRPIYSHSLLAQMFPLEGTGHFRPYAETARVRGARVGLETLWKTDLDGHWRVREWGPWANVNREENDGMGMEYHLAMIRLQFMMGAELFNSYNWDSVNEDGRAIACYNDFLRNLSAGGLVVAGERTGGDRWLPADACAGQLPVRAEFPWANTIELTLRAQASSEPLLLLLRKGRQGPVAASAVVSPADLATSGPTRVSLGDLVQVEQDDTVYLDLADDDGWELLGNEDGANYRLCSDLRAERRRSQYLARRPGNQEPAHR